MTHDTFNLSVQENYTRCIASFGGQCPFNCAFCYTGIDGYKQEKLNSIDTIIDELREKNPDIVYISGQRESFVNPDEGLELCERIFTEFQSDLMITTRNVFNSTQLQRLFDLKQQMDVANKDLFVCISIPALDSSNKIEPSNLIPSPKERIDFLSKIHGGGLYSILTLRPVFPNAFIPVSEPMQILNDSKHFIDAVIASGVVVDESTLPKLGGFPEDYTSERRNIMEILGRSILVDYVDVGEELEQIKNACRKQNLYFAEHSMSVVEYLKNLPKRT
jgi:DNA repair photolyase